MNRVKKEEIKRGQAFASELIPEKSWKEAMNQKTITGLSSAAKKFFRKLFKLV